MAIVTPSLVIWSAPVVLVPNVPTSVPALKVTVCANVVPQNSIKRLINDKRKVFFIIKSFKLIIVMQNYIIIPTKAIISTLN